jgi:hypothetical protein
MIAMGGPPQERINELLLDRSDVLIGIFKKSFGTFGGAAEEVQRFLRKGRSRKVMLYFHRADSLHDPALRQFYDDMEKLTYLERYGDESELVQRIAFALQTRVQRSRAIPHVAALREALDSQRIAWARLNRQRTPARGAYKVLNLAGLALDGFLNAVQGLPLGEIEEPADEMLRQINTMTRDSEAFIRSATWSETEAIIESVAAFSLTLPAAEDLI